MDIPRRNLYFLAERLGMSVQQVLQLPAPEVAGWFAHFKLSAEEHKQELERQKNKQRGRFGR